MAEEEKNWLQRIYGPTWKELTDLDTYKDMFDFTDPENLRSWGDVGAGVPASEGIEEMVEDYAIPTWQSYEELENPKLSRAADLAKVVPNAAWNLAQFGGNMFIEGGHALDKMMPTWLGGQDAPIFSKESKYNLDAMMSDKFGWDPYYEDNPYAEKNKDILEGIYDTAQTEADDYWNDILKKNDKNKDEWHDGVVKYTNKQVPEYSEWAWDNPAADVEDYDKMWTDAYNNRLEDLYGDQYDSVHDNSIKSQMFSEYGFGEKDKSAFEDWNWWDHSRALDYSTPEAEESLGALEIVPEVFFPLGGLSKLKHLKSFRKVPKKEGIMGVKRIEDANNKYKHAEEWLKQNAGWRGSGR
jgi:hypothetical protein